MSGSDVKLMAAGALASEVERLLNGPPNGTHMTLAQYLTQWARVQGALEAFREAQRIRP